jgi:hypothetical protein
MKKLLVMAFFATIFTNAKSQVYIQGGVNLANITKTNSGATDKYNMLTTFNAGILGRFNISTIFDLETGLLLDGRGSKAYTYFTNATDDNYVKATFNPLYLEVPLNLILRVPLEKNTGIFFNAGPYIAMGIAGKSKTEGKTAGVAFKSSDNISWTSTDPNSQNGAYNKLKRYDFGLNVGGGLDLGKVLLKANYGMGFTKINSTQTNNSANDKNKYRTLSLSLGIPLN